MSVRLKILLPLMVVAIAVTTTLWMTTTELDGQGRRITNGREGGSEIRPLDGSKNRTDMVRPITNQGNSSNVVRYLQDLMGSYGNIGMANEYPNPYLRLEPWGELPEVYNGIMPSPIGAETGPDGLVYTLLRCVRRSCDGQPHDPIVVWDLEGNVVRSFGAGHHKAPHGLHVDGDNNVWTADQSTSLVRKYSSEGELLMVIGTEDVQNPDGVANQLYEPTDVITDADGFVYITNSHDKMGEKAFLAKYSAEGEFVGLLGDGPIGGNGPLQLDEPHSMAIDIRGRLFISDRSNNRILIWTRDGEYIDEWRQFSRPSGIYITNHDKVYVFDSESYGFDNPGWQKGFRVGSALTGVVSYYAMDVESRDFAHSGPEGGGVDSEGNVYAAAVRRQQMERHEPLVPEPNTRNAAWGPYVDDPSAFRLAQ